MKFWHLYCLNWHLKCQKEGVKMLKKENFKCQNWLLTFMKWTTGSAQIFAFLKKKKFLKQNCQRKNFSSNLKFSIFENFWRSVKTVMKQRGI